MVGPNGAGKTNLLDAIHFLCHGRSKFLATDSQNVRHGQGFAQLKGQVERDELLNEIFMAVMPGRKKTIKVDGDAVTKLAHFYGRFPVVFISPYDIVLIQGGAEERRRLLDSTISQYDSDYLTALSGYNKILAQRNALLKSNPDAADALLEVYDIQLCELGGKIYKGRLEFVEAFQPLHQDFYQAIAEHKETVTVQYESKLHDASMLEGMRASRQKDRLLQRTSFGVHKDDLELILGEHSIKRYGSQGQQKTYLIACKLAMAELIRERTGRKAFLLLDDIFDRLDEQRMKCLVPLILNQSTGQVFITDTSEDRLRQAFSGLEDQAQFVKVEDSQLSDLTKHYDRA